MKEEEEKLKLEIINLLHKATNKFYTKDSCGELGDENLAIDCDDIPEVADDIIKLIKKTKITL